MRSGKSGLIQKDLDRPAWAGAPDSVKGKLWIMEQAGTVWIVDLKTGERAKESFLNGGKASDFKDHTSTVQPEGGRINLISAFGEDADGEIYLVDLSGSVYRITGE